MANKAVHSSSSAREPAPSGAKLPADPARTARKNARAVEVNAQVTIPAGGAVLEGDLRIPPGAEALVIFVQGSGSSRHSPRNQFVAGVMREAGLGTLLFDLLTNEEEAGEDLTREIRLDIGLLTRRLLGVVRWLRSRPDTAPLQLGFFGASTGAAAALVGAAELGEAVGAVVCRGGRPDLAGDALSRVVCPVLLMVGGLDDALIDLNEEALERLQGKKEMRIIVHATHLFEEPGTLDQVAQLAASWFRRHCRAVTSTGGAS